MFVNTVVRVDGLFRLIISNIHGSFGNVRYYKRNRQKKA